MVKNKKRFKHMQQQQRGVVLVVALIVLVAMSLAAVGLMRSVDTTTGVSGNLAFRESAVTSADPAIEQGVAFLEANRTTGALNEDKVSEGYYAVANMLLTGSTASPTDWSRYDWTNRAKKLPKDVAGNTAEYIIERLCSKSGSFAGENTCATKDLPESESGNDKEAGGGTPFTQSYLSYRVTARITDPKGATTYIQVMSY